MQRAAMLRVHSWMAKASHLLSQLVFLVWTAFLTYRNGPYYTMLELCRNFQIFGYRKLEYDKEFTAPLNGKVCVITGGTRGIGLEVVRFLFAKGCIVLTGTSTLPSDSSPENIAKYKHNLLLQVLKTEVIDQTTKDLVANRLVVLPLDLTSMASVVKFANEISQVTSKIDYMICNGGAMFVPFRLTRDNFECHMSINYLSHCLLIVKLLPLLSSPSALSARAKSRIVVVSSGAHHASLGLRLHDLHSTSLYSVYHGYAQSKLALVMFTYRFHRWLQSRPDLSSQVTINCLHPGVCRTGLMERFNFFKLKFIQETPFFRSAREGAETILYTALSNQESDNSGQYFENCTASRSSPLSYDPSLQNELWLETWTQLRPWLDSDQLSQLSTI